MNVFTAGKKIEALESEVVALKSELRKLAKSIDLRGGSGILHTGLGGISA